MISKLDVGNETIHLLWIIEQQN